MLTSTYAMVALALEQTQLQADILAFQQALAGDFSFQSQLTAAQVMALRADLNRLRAQCAARKFERHLLPALRTLPAAAAALDEVAAWQHSADQALAAANAGAREGEAAVASLCSALDTACEALLASLKLEEHSLLPLARTQLSEESWFALAHQMLAEGARQPAETRHFHAHHSWQEAWQA